MIRKHLPWGEEAPSAQWTDHHESLTRVWFEREDIKPGQGDIGRAVQAAARNNPIHAVREYFNAFVWDGTPRLDTWLATYFHAEDSDYVRAVGPRYLISAVARIHKPGCKVDHLLILEGPQGKQKSEALRTLAISDDWFTDRLSNIAGKDAALETAGVLIVEIAEMDALTKATSSAIKSFLTRRHDRFRPPYGKHTIRLLRQCVFAGTINPTVGGYLKDPTGARRFWPVACRGMIESRWSRTRPRQLWAEAVHRYRAGTKWWLETPELEALATAEQVARFKTDVWTQPIKQWLGRRKDVSIGEVLRDALRLESRDQTHSAQIRVSSILQGIHRPSNILALNPRCLFNRHLKRVSGVDDYLRHRVRQEIKADRERHLVHKYSSERSRPDTDQPSAPLLYGGPVHSAQRIPEEYWHNDPVTSEWRRSISRLDDKLRTLQETYEALPASNPARATNCA